MGAKNYVHEVKKTIKLSKIVKNGPEIVKNENFQKKNFFLLFLCHNEPTCQKLCLRVEWVGFWPIQRQRGKNSEIFFKGPKNVKNENFETRKNTFFPTVLK